MQISKGTVTVENGSTRVIASPEVDWTDVLIATQYGTPVFFILGTTGVPRSVTAAEGPDTSASGNWELTLAAPWDGEDQEGAEYLVHKDFTKNLQLPLPTAGERGWAQLLSDALVKIDANYGGGGIPIGSPNTPLIVTVPSGKTLYMTGIVDIPEGVTVDIQDGGALEVG